MHFDSFIEPWFEPILNYIITILTQYTVRLEINENVNTLRLDELTF